MNEAIRTRNPWRTVAMVLIAVLVLLMMALAAMLQPTTTAGAGGRAVPSGVHATSIGGSGSTDNPYLDRHAEVVAAYRGSPR